MPVAGVQTSFESILGLTVREQVIFLGGGHSFGGATLDGSGWNGSFTGGDNWPKVRSARKNAVVCVDSRAIPRPVGKCSMWQPGVTQSVCRVSKLPKLGVTIFSWRQRLCLILLYAHQAAACSLCAVLPAAHQQVLH